MHHVLFEAKWNGTGDHHELASKANQDTLFLCFMKVKETSLNQAGACPPG